MYQDKDRAKLFIIFFVQDLPIIPTLNLTSIYNMIKTLTTLLTVWLGSVALIAQSSTEIAALKDLAKAYPSLNWTGEDYSLWHGVDLENNSVTHLDLANTALGDNLPASVYQFPNLKMLTLKGCGLKTLPNELANLKDLRVIDLGSNKLTSFPSVLSKLPNLVLIHLENNQLSTLPAEVASLSNLEELHAENNQLSSLSPELGNLKKLSTFYIHQNNLETVPDAILKLPFQDFSAANNYFPTSVVETIEKTVAGASAQPQKVKDPAAPK